MPLMQEITTPTGWVMEVWGDNTIWLRSPNYPKDQSQRKRLEEWLPEPKGKRARHAD